MATKVVPESNQCKNCRYSRDIGNAEGVACHRYPPTITKVEGQTISSHFPLLNNSAWCGEYKRRVH